MKKPKLLRRSYEKILITLEILMIIKNLYNQINCKKWSPNLQILWLKDSSQIKRLFNYWFSIIQNHKANNNNLTICKHNRLNNLNNKINSIWIDIRNMINKLRSWKKKYVLWINLLNLLIKISFQLMNKHLKNSYLKLIRIFCLLLVTMIQSYMFMI